MSDFKIEKGIPMPHKKTLYPTHEMEVGDSFFVPCSDEKKTRTQNRISNAYIKRHGAGKFSSRRVEGGVRVWRIEEKDDANQD